MTAFLDGNKKATTSADEWSRSRKHQSGGFDEPHSSDLGESMNESDY